MSISFNSCCCTTYREQFLRIHISRARFVHGNISHQPNNTHFPAVTVHPDRISFGQKPSRVQYYRRISFRGSNRINFVGGSSNRFSTKNETCLPNLGCPNCFMSMRLLSTLSCPSRPSSTRFSLLSSREIRRLPVSYSDSGWYYSQLL